MADFFHRSTLRFARAILDWQWNLLVWSVTPRGDVPIRESRSTRIVQRLRVSSTIEYSGQSHRPNTCAECCASHMHEAGKVLHKTPECSFAGRSVGAPKPASRSSRGDCLKLGRCDSGALRVRSMPASLAMSPNTLPGSCSSALRCTMLFTAKLC